MREFLKFCLQLVLFSFLLSAAIYFFLPSVPVKFRYESWWKISVFFTIVTALFHFGLLKSTGRRPASVTMFYMGATTFRLLLYAGIMIGYSLTHKNGAMPFILHFFLMYFLYTIFEVGTLYKKFSSTGKKNQAGKESGQ